MTEYYAYYLRDAFRQYENRGTSFSEYVEKTGIGTGVINAIRPVFNRFVKIGATYMDVLDFLEGRSEYNSKVIEYYIRFVCKDDQLSSVDLANKMGIYDVGQLRRMLHGMAIKNPDCMSYVNTFDLDTLTIKRAWHKNGRYI